MSVQENKMKMSELTQIEQETVELYRAFEEEIYNKGNLAAVDELVAEDFRHHAPFPTPQGREGFKQFIAGFNQAFPDSTSTTEDVVVEGEKVAVRYTMRGTHQGEFVGIPATGKRIEVEGISIYRVVDGKIADEWSQPDMVGMMQQLGVASAPGA